MSVREPSKPGHHAVNPALIHLARVLARAAVAREFAAVRKEHEREVFEQSTQ